MDSPRRAGSPIALASRLLQPTASTMLKSKEPTSLASPIQRESLSFHTMLRSNGSPCRSDSPVKHQQRPQSPRCRAEAYALHFQGTSVASLLGSAPNSRSNSPMVAAGRQVRRQSPHREDSMFGSECPTNHRVARQSSLGVNGAAGATRQPGLWARKEGGDDRAAYTGSRRHFNELQQAVVVGSTPASSPLAQCRSLESTLDAIDVCSVAGSDAGSAACGGQRFSKRMLEQQHNISGSSCNVALEQPIAVRGKQRSERGFRKTAPYSDYDAQPARSFGDEGSSAPSNSAPMQAAKQAAPRSSILDYREGGWEGQHGQTKRRERAAVDGFSSTASRNLTNLAALSAAQVGERPNSIKTMPGPPAFIPPPMRAPSPLGQRVDSPFRAMGQNGTFSIATMSAVSHNIDGSSVVSCSGTTTPRGNSPMRSGRAVGLYSPLRQSSPFQ